MNEYETEDQQLEAIKKWLKENSPSLIFGVLAGLATLFGWRYYIDHQHVHAMQGSDLYMQVVQSVASERVDDKTIDIHNQLLNEYTNTPYAALSALLLAKSEYQKGNVDAATAQLQLAIKYAADEETKQVANLRLASVYIEQKKFDEAKTALDTSHESAFEAQYEELRGDLYAAKGDMAEARKAYDSAIDLQGFAASRWLKLKRQNLDNVTEEANDSGVTEAVSPSS
jgi:predicted negative regulator of RcsB-dependent stress response